MAEFEVRISMLEQCPERIDTVAGYLNRYVSTVESVRRNLQICGSFPTEIISRLNNIGSRLEEYERSTRQIGQVLEEIAERYRETEERISDGAKSVSVAAETSQDRLLHGNIAADTNPPYQRLPVSEIKNLFYPGVVTLLSIIDKLWRIRPFLQKLGGDDSIRSVSVLSGETSRSGTLFGMDGSTTASGNLLGASWDYGLESGIEWKTKKDKNGNENTVLDSVSLIKGSVSGEGHVAQGKVEQSIGMLRITDEATLGKIEGKGEIGVTLFDDGKLDPKIQAEVEAGVVGLEAKSGASFGTDNTNIHGEGEVKVGVADAKAKGGVGKVTYEGKNGKEVEGFGLVGEVGAEAYAAEGTVSGGTTVFGIDIDVDLSGKAGGAGVTAGGAVTTGGVTGKIGLGLLFGFDVGVTIDWSDFHFGWW